MFESIVLVITRILEAIAILVVIWGALIAAIAFIKREFRSIHTVEKVRPQESLRLNFSTKLVLSLEFFLASDIVRTVISPTWNSVGLLAVLIILRTLLSYILMLELKQKEVH